MNLPSDIVPQSIIDRYTPLLEKNHIIYESIVDLLNSSILDMSFPGLGIETPSQTLHYGKQRNYRPVTNINDIASTRELVLTFKRIESDLNYWLLYDIFTNKYLDTENIFAEPFQLMILDIHRDSIYTVSFKEIILTNLSEIIFAYNQQDFNMQTFSLTFNYNFLDIEFNLNKEKVLELNPDEIPVIKQRNFNGGDASKINLD